MPKKKCNFCKKEYHAKRSVQKYCSTKCQTDSLVQVPVLHTCKREGCENTFNVGRQKNPKQFCCSSCAATVNNTLTPKRSLEGNCADCQIPIPASLKFCPEHMKKYSLYEKSIIECICKNENCLKPFKTIYSTKMFCNINCRKDYSSKNQILDASRSIVCPSCGKSKAATSKYCSKCWAEERRNSRIQSWLNGEWSGGSANSIADIIRLHLLEEANYICSSVGCGFNTPHPSDGKTVLEVDHIDGNGSNHVPSNLRVLCPNCHALTSSYRGRNVGNGRKVYYLRIGA
jgi:hypothetical protein